MSDSQDNTPTKDNTINIADHLRVIGDDHEVEVACLLDEAKDADLEEAIVVGVDKDGLLYVSSTGGVAETHLHLHLAMAQLMGLRQS